MTMLAAAAFVADPHALLIAGLAVDCALCFVIVWSLWPLMRIEMGGEP